jgi:hypothetical protein
VLKWNGLLPALLGLKFYPHPTTLRRFFHHWEPLHLQSLQKTHDDLRQYAWNHLFPLHSALLDADATVITSFGHQQGAVLGYNPLYRGHKSYAPMLLLESRSGLSMFGQWRPGNIHPASNILQILQKALSLLPSSMSYRRIRFRGDHSFYDGDLVRFLDDQGMGYAIVARITKSLRRELEHARFRPFRFNRAIGELTYHPARWNRPTRIVATRRSLTQPPDPHQPDLFTTEQYAYHALATNLTIRREQAMRFYYRRAQQELVFRELKNDSTLACIPTRRFNANALHLELLLWAYDLVRLFQHACLPVSCQNWTLHTVQREIWGLPAFLSRTQNKNQVHLPPSFPHQDLFNYAQKRLASIQPWNIL